MSNIPIVRYGGGGDYRIRVVGPDGVPLCEFRAPDAGVTLYAMEDTMGKQLPDLKHWLQFSHRDTLPIVKTQTMREQGIKHAIPGLLRTERTLDHLRVESGGAIYAYLCDDGTLNERVDLMHVINHSMNRRVHITPIPMHYSQPIELLRAEASRAKAAILRAGYPLP